MNETFNLSIGDAEGQAIHSLIEPLSDDSLGSLHRIRDLFPVSSLQLLHYDAVTNLDVVCPYIQAACSTVLEVSKALQLMKLYRWSYCELADEGFLIMTSY